MSTMITNSILSQPGSQCR